MTKLQPHQERVVEEHKELAGRIERLDAFTDSKKFDSLSPEDQDLMLHQTQQMKDLAKTLSQRIELFKAQ